MAESSKGRVLNSCLLGLCFIAVAFISIILLILN